MDPPAKNEREELQHSYYSPCHDDPPLLDRKPSSSLNNITATATNMGPLSTRIPHSNTTDKDDNGGADAKDAGDDEASLGVTEIFPTSQRSIDLSVVSSRSGDRPYQQYERDRQARQIRKQQRAYRAEQRAKQQSGTSSSQHSSESSEQQHVNRDDPEQPMPQSAFESMMGASKMIKTYAEDFVQYTGSGLAGNEFQLALLFLLLVATCVVVGLLDRGNGDNDTETRDMVLNITSLSPTLSPMDDVNDTSTASSAMPPSIVQPSPSAPVVAATVSATASPTAATNTTPNDVDDNDELVVVQDDFTGLNNEGADVLELYSVHVAGDTVSVHLQFPDLDNHMWYMAMEFVPLGVPCADRAVPTTPAEGTTMPMATDMTIVLCRDYVVVGTSTHLFLDNLDDTQAYEAVPLSATNGAALTTTLRRNTGNDATLVVAVVTEPQETVVRFPAARRRRQRRLRDPRNPWGKTKTACPTNGVALASSGSDEYPIWTWIVDDNDTAQELVVCDANGIVRARGIVTIDDDVLV